MYIPRLTLPQFSNREDFLLTCAIFDDDTGQPVDLDGITVAGNSAFTASAWTVTDGAIITTSATQITLPVFPMSGQLSALALTVGAGLGILQGDPITIKDTATGKNFATGYVISYSIATGALVVQIGVTFQFQIRLGGPRNTGSGFIPFFDFGTPETTQPLLSATLGSGITILDVGVFQVFIPEIQFRQLVHRSYQAACTITDSVNTRQVFVAELPVLIGGVTL